MDTLLALSILSMAVLVILSGMFSASETAFTSVNRIRIKKLAEDGNKKARKALSLLDRYGKLLTTILVGNNLVNILSSSLCTFIFTAQFGANGVIMATVFMLVVILAVGEITPKCIAKSRPERIVMMFTPVMSTLMTVFTPITLIFEKFSLFVTTQSSMNTEESPTLTEEELKLMVNEIEEEGEIEAAESDLIKSAMEFDDKTVSEILTPRVDIVGINKNASMEEVKTMFLRSGFSRLPVYNGTMDRIIGVLYSKDFYEKYFSDGRDDRITSVIRRVRFIPESTTVAKAFAEIQRSSVQMLVVIDDYGGTVGIVSLEDVLEELVGEIWDESDEVEYDIVEDGDGGFTVLGDANINDLMDAIGTRFDIEEYDGSTVGGFIQYKLQKMPITGDKVRIDDVTMIAASVRNRRIRIVKVTVETPEEDSEDSQ